MLFTLSKILSEATAQYYEYFDVLFKQMLNKTEIFEFLNINITDNDELIDELTDYHILIQNYIKRSDEN